MRDADRLIRGDHAGKNRDELFHRRNVLALGAAILLDPARDLPLEIAAGTPEITKADRFVIDLMQFRERGVQFVIDGCALLWRQFLQARIAKDAAFQEVHHIEARADDGLVLLQQAHARNGNVGVLQRLHHAIFAIDLMGTGEQLARRLFPQHIAEWAVRSLSRQLVGWVGCAALDLLHAQVAAETVDVPFKMRLELRFVEAQRRNHVADIVFAHSRLAHSLKEEIHLCTATLFAKALRGGRELATGGGKSARGVTFRGYYPNEASEDKHDSLRKNRRSHREADAGAISRHANERHG